MIPTSYAITLQIIGAHWHWTVHPEDQDDEESPVKFGQSGDYLDACRAALAAHDRLVAESGER